NFLLLKVLKKSNLSHAGAINLSLCNARVSDICDKHEFTLNFL
ncbi:4268_t:CDS:1, partial [Racocetra fulgida]